MSLFHVAFLVGFLAIPAEVYCHYTSDYTVFSQQNAVAHPQRRGSVSSKPKPRTVWIYKGPVDQLQLKCWTCDAFYVTREYSCA